MRPILLVSIVALVIFALVIIAFLFYLLFNKLSGFRRLFATGYVLTHPHLKSLAFEDFMDAKDYRDRAKRRGIDYDIYLVNRGEISRMP